MIPWSRNQYEQTDTGGWGSPGRGKLRKDKNQNRGQIRGEEEMEIDEHTYIHGISLNQGPRVGLRKIFGLDAGTIRDVEGPGPPTLNLSGVVESWKPSSSSIHRSTSPAQITSAVIGPYPLSLHQSCLGCKGENV